ncbi:DeoR/GlpR family DNA-binding transcription regulator [Microbacterium sp. P5_E9]
MSRAERLNAILDLLAETGQVEVDEIVSRLDISPATARRDLDSLAEQQLLTRTRGGAIPHSVAYELPVRYRSESGSGSKQRIAAAASALIAPGAVIGLSGGTTTTAIAAALSVRADLMQPSPTPNLTVVTNAVNIAAQLATRSTIKLVLTGGVVNPRTYELVGDFADPVLRSVSLDIAFIGANGVDPTGGPSTDDEREAAVNRLMATRARRAVIVADSSKLAHRAFASMGNSDLFPTIITDDGISVADRTALSDAGYEVIVAP